MPEDVLGTVPGSTSTTSFGGMPTASATSRVTAFCTSSGVRGLGDDDDVLCAVAAVDTERDHVAGAHALDAAGDLLDVLRVHVAPADDDDVLDPAAHDELAVDRVGEVAGVQPPVPDELGGRLGVLVVAGGQRVAGDAQLAHLAVAAGLAGVGVDDAELEAVDRAAQHDQLGGVARALLDRHRPPLGLERDLVDQVGLEARPGTGEGPGDAHLGHAEGGERRGRVDAEPGRLVEERPERVGPPAPPLSSTRSRTGRGLVGAPQRPGGDVGEFRGPVRCPVADIHSIQRIGVPGSPGARPAQRSRGSSGS